MSAYPGRGDRRPRLSAGAFSSRRNGGRADLWGKKRRPASNPAMMSPIIEHPDVKRMLLEMRSKTSASARHLLCDRQCASIASHRAEDAADPKMAAHRRGEPAHPRRKSLLDRYRRRGRLRPACRSMAAWASSRRPARRSICAMRASQRSMRARTAFRRSISSPANWRNVGWCDGQASPSTSYREAAEATRHHQRAGLRDAPREILLTRRSMRSNAATDWMLEDAAGAAPPMRLPVRRPICGSYGVTAGRRAIWRSLRCAARVALAAGESDGVYASRADAIAAFSSKTSPLPPNAASRPRSSKARMPSTAPFLKQRSKETSVMSLKGKTLFITGASRGIGLAIASARRTGWRQHRRWPPRPRSRIRSSKARSITAAKPRSRRRAARRLPLDGGHTR